MFARVLSESAAALLAGCSGVFNERGGSGTRDAEGSAFAAIVDLFSVVAESFWNDALFGSVG
jgi:hypothetical protein